VDCVVDMLTECGTLGDAGRLETEDDQCGVLEYVHGVFPDCGVLGEEADKRGTQTGQCGAVDGGLGLLPDCSIYAGSSMTGVKCTPVQSYKLVLTTSGTTCDRQKVTIDKEMEGSSIIDSGVCGSTPEIGYGSRLLPHREQRGTGLFFLTSSNSLRLVNFSLRTKFQQKNKNLPGVI
jgi:hypothetical protein